MQYFLTGNMLVTRYRLPVLVHHVGDLARFQEYIFVHSRYRDALLPRIKPSAQPAMNLFTATGDITFTVNMLLLLLLVIKKPRLREAGIDLSNGNQSSFLITTSCGRICWIARTIQ